MDQKQCESAADKVCVVQRLIPHYRLRVFENLSLNKCVHFTIITGDTDLDNLQAMRGEALSRIRHRIAQVRTFRIGSLLFSWQPDVWRILRQEKPSVVVVHGGFYDLTSWAVLVWGRIQGTRVLSWTIGLQRPERGPKLWLRLIFYKLARGLLIYGDYPKRLLQDAGLDATSMHVIYNSLDVDAQRKAEASLKCEDLVNIKDDLGFTAEAKYLIFIGRIVKRKRLSIVLEALSNLSCNVNLILIGDGEDRRDLEHLSKRMGLAGRVHFVGALFDELEIAKYMRFADAAIVPEAGLPIIHPMGYGVPPIISDNIHQHGTEWEAVEEGQTGYFYRDGDAGDLARVIRSCLNDEGGRRAVANSCRARVQDRYTADGHAARIVAGVCALRP